MKSLEEVLERRQQIRYFKQDEYPEKKIIEDIIEKSHHYTPYKNSLVGHSVTVWGPEYYKEKEDLVLTSVCGENKQNWMIGGKHYGDYKLLKKIYDGWRHKNYEDPYRDTPFQGINFNEQLRAPYLLVFSKNVRNPTISQHLLKYKNFEGEITDKKINWYKFFETKKGTEFMDMSIVSGSMQALVINLLAQNESIDSSFCKCFHYDPIIRNPIIENINPRKKSPVFNRNRRANDIMFILSLGYKDDTVYNHSWHYYPLLEEYVEWK